MQETPAGSPPPSAAPGRGSPDRRFDLLSLGTFIVVGLPDGMLGTAWPAMRHSFGAPVGQLGLILLVNTLGSVVIAAFVGRLIQRLGISALLAVASVCAALGGVGYAAAPGLWLILALGPLLGAAIGMMDGGLNTAVALTGRPRLLNLLHGFYGIGTALGPLIVTAAIVAGSWRPAYLLLVALDLATAALWVRQHRRVPPPAAPRDPGASDAGEDPAAGDPAAAWSRRRLASALALGLIVFFVYTGLEVSAGQWETSYLRGHLHMSASGAGLAAFGYWGALTAVRIGLALPARPVPVRHVIGWGMVASTAAAALIWWQPDTAVVVAGFALLGAALAGMFPALIAITPQRIGERRAQHAIAWQVGAAAAGGSGISAILGLLIDTTSLAILGPALLVLALLLAVANAALARVAPLPRPDGRERG
ncbi:MAG TPA: MFS transporter [Trebonia sp.]|nr:MFS transporter [Trebonia sp.]